MLLVEKSVTFRNLALFFICTVVGAAIAYAANSHFLIWSSGSTAVQEPSPAFQRDQHRFAAMSPTLAAVTIYTGAAEYVSASALEDQLQILIADPVATAGKAQLEALLVRFLEVDATRAIRFALSNEIPSEIVDQMFQVWAEQDIDAALSELARSENYALVRRVSLLLVDEVGHTTEQIDKLVALVDDANRDGFQSDILAHVAESAPQWAFERALAVSDTNFRALTVQRVGAAWARQDPWSALAQLSRIADPELRHMYHIRVVSEWAVADPDATADYVFAGDGRSLLALDIGGVSRLINRLVVQRPEAVFAASESLRGRVGSELRVAALKSLVEQDVLLAAAQLEQMDVGQARAELLDIVSVAYAHQKPQDAIAWAKRVEATIPGALGLVLTEIAGSDIESAISIALEDGRLGPLIGNWLTLNSLSQAGAESVERIAIRLLGSGVQEAAVAKVLVIWPQLSAETSLAWFRQADAAIQEQYSEQIAEGLARNNAALTARVIDTLPVNLRGQWIETVVPFFIKQDQRAAMDWLSRYETEPEFDEWISAAAAKMVAGAPLAHSVSEVRAAANLLAASEKPSESVSASVAESWSYREPREAARWALELADTTSRSMAVATVAGTWSIDDPTSAETWARSLPVGDERDRALRSYLAQNLASHGSVDTSVLDEFKSSASRQQALDTMRPGFVILGSRDPNRAAQLISNYIVDDETRRGIAADIQRLREDRIVLSPNTHVHVRP